MGSKYRIRTNEQRVFPLEIVNYTDYYANSLFEYIKILIIKRKKLIFVTKYY